MQRTLRNFLLALTVFFSFPQVALSEEASGWEWHVAPYLWMANVSADLKLNDKSTGVDQSFGDILGKLKMAGQIHFEGAKGKYGFFADYTYLSIGDKSTMGPLKLDSNMKLNLFELAAVYRPSGEFAGFQVFGGIRYIAVDQSTKISGQGPLPITPPNISLDKSATDLMVGARYLGEINDRWWYSLRADASGGNTKGTWSLIGLVGYRFPNWQSGSAILGYRHMNIDLEGSDGGNDVRIDLEMTGPFLGLGIDF